MTAAAVSEEKWIERRDAVLWLWILSTHISERQTAKFREVKSLE